MTIVLSDNQGRRLFVLALWEAFLVSTVFFKTWLGTGRTFATKYLFQRLILPLVLLFFASIICWGAQSAVRIDISGDLNAMQRQNVIGHLSLSKLPGQDLLPEDQFDKVYALVHRETAKALEPFGFYNAVISADKAREDGAWVVRLHIQAGQPVVVRSVAIEVAGAGEDDPAIVAAVNTFSLQQGEVFDHQRYEAAKDALIARALDNGYLKAVFRGNRVEVRRKEYSADIRLHFLTGQRYVYGPITFQADFIDHELLRKIAPFKEGDPFTPKSLNHFRQSLYNAGYFSTVELQYAVQKAMDAKVPITVLLTPNLAHKYGVGLGYGTDTGIRGTLEYNNRHINRWGHQLDLQWQPAEHKDSFSSVYTIPIGDPKRDRLSILGNYQTENFNSTETEGWTSIVSHDHFRDWGEYSTYVEFLDERYTTGEDTGHATLIIPAVKGSLYWADDRIVTKRGLRLTASLLGSEESALGDTSFLQAAVRAKGIWSFGEQWRLIGRADWGTTVVDDIVELPPSLRYYAGGDQSVRGYGYRKIGPTNAEGQIIGGKNLFVYSLEIERTLFDEWSGAVFYDCGGVSDTFSQVTMKSGAGVGVRWNAPFGQVRLDLAKAIDDAGTWRIHFTIGADL